MDAITAFDLTKRYGSQSALYGLNLQVPAGSAFACVGRECSGKTTLIRLLSGLCRPSAGECSVLGFSPFFEAGRLHAVSGTVLDTAQLYKNRTVSENLLFFAGINGVDENDALDRLSFLLHRLDIWESRDEKVESLPTSVVRRASLARALIHNPRILLMDEPADGLDRETGESMGELFSHLVSQEGMTLLLATRNPYYAQRTCDNFALLRDGILMGRGDLETLRKNAGVRYRAILRLKEGEAPLGGFRPVENGEWEKEIDSEKELAEIISKTVSSGKTLYEARLIKPYLEEIYTAYLNGGIQRGGNEDEQQDDRYQESGEIAGDETETNAADEGEQTGEAEAAPWA